MPKSTKYKHNKWRVGGQGRPLCLLCTCKGFKHYHICSHVLAISHVLKGMSSAEYVRREQVASGRAGARPGLGETTADAKG